MFLSLPILYLLPSLFPHLCTFPFLRLFLRLCLCVQPPFLFLWFLLFGFFFFFFAFLPFHWGLFCCLGCWCLSSFSFSILCLSSGSFPPSLSSFSSFCPLSFVDPAFSGFGSVDARYPALPAVLDFALASSSANLDCRRMLVCNITLH